MVPVEDMCIIQWALVVRSTHSYRVYERCSVNYWSGTSAKTECLEHAYGLLATLRSQLMNVRSDRVSIVARMSLPTWLDIRSA